MKQYPPDWDIERISDDQTGKALLVITILFVIIVGILIATGVIHE